MSDDLVLLRMLLVAAVRSHQDLWRQGAALASVPIDFEARDAAGARVMLARGGVDICVLDGAMSDADKVSVIKAARAMQAAPLVFCVRSARERAPRQHRRRADETRQCR
jgi:CheY-like chemotaxis protein